MLWDLLPSGQFLGGAPFNFVYRVASIGDRGTMVSRIGTDELGQRALGTIERLGMSSVCIQRDPVHPTGTVPIAIGPDGAMDITINPDVAYDYIEPSPEAVDAVRAADCVCFGTLIQRRATSRRTLHALLADFRGRLRLLDLNLRRDCWTPASVRSSIQRADVLKLNDDEATTVAGLLGLPAAPLAAFAARLLGATKLSHVVITLGGNGAYAVSRDGETAYGPAFEVRMADALGSGDAFAAGFAHGLMSGWPLAEVLRYGNALGGCVAAQHGATEALSEPDVERMLREGRHRPPDPRFA